MSMDEQFRKQLQSLTPSGKEIEREIKKNAMKATSALIQARADKEDPDLQEAEIELSYIRAAVTLCSVGSNDISAELTIGQLPSICISLNKRLVSILMAEAEEIEKYLRGEENNYE